MDGFVWRRRARLVAYYDVVHATYWLLVVLFESCVLGYKTVYPSPVPNDRFVSHLRLFVLTYISSNTLDMINTASWICSLFLYVGSFLWVSLKLLRATEFGRDVNQAWAEVDERWEKMWPTFYFAFWTLRCYFHFILHDAVVAYVMSIDGFELGLSWMEFVLIAAWHISLHTVVSKFMEELRVRNLELGQVAGRRTERIRVPGN